MSNELLLDDISWFRPVRENMLNEWQTKTTITSSEGAVDSLACSLARAVNLSAGHLSISCSLHNEANQIEKLFLTTCFDDDPVLFFRFFLFLIDEFTARLEDCYKLLGKIPKPKQPDLISIWTNRYAKHRTAILIQHHARHLFFDDLHTDQTIEKLKCEGNVVFIDTNWLKRNPEADPSSANQNLKAVLIVPRFNEFFSATIDYYSLFRDFACSKPIELAQFQSPHH